jgi:hypothetical protein
MRTDQPPYVWLSQHEAEIQVGGKPVTLRADGFGKRIVWRIDPPYNQLAYLNQAEGDSVTIDIACEDIDELVSFPVTACAVGDSVVGGVAVCQMTIKPSQLPPPSFLKEPVIKIKDGIVYLDYTLDLQGRRDESRIIWSRLDTDDCQKEVVLAYSNDGPQRQYKLRAGDVGRRLMATIRPAHQRSPLGDMTEVASSRIKDKNIKGSERLETDFSDIYCGTTHGLLPDSWQADGFKPADTAEFPWTFDSKKPMWEYGEGFNGAVGKGLLQAQRGARLMYTPADGQYGDMSLILNVDPTKTAGQGFGSATGQYMDVCLKFDTKTLTGYGLRIIRTTKHAKAVDFYLVEYDHGQVKGISEAVSATCYRTGCTISLKAENGYLKADVETTTPQPEDSTLPHVVNLIAPMKTNNFGGIAIQHTGSCGESTTMLHRLEVNWDKQ